MSSPREAAGVALKPVAELMLSSGWRRVSIEVAFATPAELKAQFIMPMSYERGRIRLQAQQKEARRHIVSLAHLPFLSACAASSPRPNSELKPESSEPQIG